MVNKSIFKLTSVLIILLIGFLYTNSPYAQDTDNNSRTPGGSVNKQQDGAEATAIGQTWRCMDERPIAGEELKIIPSGTPASPRDIVNHRRHLTAKGLNTDQCYYMVACIDTENGTHCTTGNDSYDQYLFGDFVSPIGNRIGNYTYLNTSNKEPLPFWFIVQDGSKVCNPKNGVIERIAVSATMGVTTHSWMLVSVIEAEQINEGEDKDTATLHYGTFQFTGDPGACDGVRWDPMGRVFDAKSLEPVSGVTTTIRDATSGQPVSYLIHTKTTDQSGMYSYFTDPGQYLIDVVELPEGFNWTTNPNLHTNWNKVYQNLNTPGTVINEYEGEVAIADIAIESALPYRNDAHIIRYKVVQTGQSMLIQGLNTHPYTKVNVMQNEQTIETAHADSFGSMTIKLPNSKVDPTIKIELFLEKVDLTNPDFNPSLLQSFINWIIPPAHAQKTAALIIDPLPTYLEGYAYSQTGKALPNTKVVVRLGMTNSPYYTTMTDENGFFTILPHNLPIINYYLEYGDETSTTEQTLLTPTKFAQDNKEYLTTARVDIMRATKEGKSLVRAINTVSDEELEQQAQLTQVAEMMVAENEETTQSTTGGILTIAIIILALLIVGIGLVLFMKGRNKTNAGEDKTTYEINDPVTPVVTDVKDSTNSTSQSPPITQ